MGKPEASASGPESRMSSSQVAAVRLSFWEIKICATTLGETAGDLLSMTLDVGYALSSRMLLAMFALLLDAQLAMRTFNAPLCWAVILATSTAGTTMSDFLDRTAGLG